MELNQCFSTTLPPNNLPLSSVCARHFNDKDLIVNIGYTVSFFF